MDHDSLESLKERFAESGSEAAEIALITAQLELEVLDENALRIAAHLGHLPAQVALEQEEVEVALHSRLAAELVLVPGSSSYDWEAPLRCAVAANHFALCEWGTFIDGQECEEALLAAEQYLLDPSRRWARTAESRAEAANEASRRLEQQGGDLGQGFAMFSSVSVARCAAACNGTTPTVQASSDTPFFFTKVGQEAASAVEFAMASVELGDAGSLMNAIRAELVEWALGRGDPVRSRLEGGRRKRRRRT